MSSNTAATDEMPVIGRVEEFDKSSGNSLERLIFNHRGAILLLSALLTGFFIWAVNAKLVMNASFEKMIPPNHPFIQNYMANKDDLRGLGNSIRIVVENTRGDIYDPSYLSVLQHINDDVTLTAGVDRAWVKSIWMPVVRWMEVTEDGFDGGPVMPETLDDSGVAQLRANISRSASAQALVSTDQRSSMIVVPLLDFDSDTGKRLDYCDFSHRLENEIRGKYEASSQGLVRIHIVGFAKLIGDLIDGLVAVAAYFGIAAAIASAIIYFYTRCVRSTLLVVACSVAAVIWQLGIVSLLGYELNPFSVLVPFLVFAIGVSHGAQKMNGIMQDIGRGTHRLVAARYTFRRLFLAGLTALMADVVGFSVLMVIDIPVIRELALAASLGVGVLVFTNLVLLPILLSYTGVSQKAAARSLREEDAENQGKGIGAIWNFLDRFTERRWAIGLLAASAVITLLGLVQSARLRIGDLDPGAPELRQNSRYNLDNGFITRNFSLSSDQFAVIAKTKADGCLSYETMTAVDQMGWSLRQVPGVQTVVSLAESVRTVTSGTFEGSPKWITISRNQDTTNFAGNQAMTGNADLTNKECSVTPVVAYLADHKSETLDAVVEAASRFSSQYADEGVHFLLAAGSAGIEAATNSVVKDANRKMLLYVYGAVTLLCFIAFRSWRAVLVAVIPLAMTSILCEALMVFLGIGVKVATLPVIALGAGIGVDYALYLISVQISQQRKGVPLAQAYKGAVQFTGRVVALVGLTLGAGVVTWAWSPIRFQADMGILLTFMFIWNMLGALVLTPALSHFLLNPKAGQRI